MPMTIFQNSSFPRPAGLLIFTLLAVICSALPAGADGIVSPTQAVKKIPDIPLQRSVLVYKDGLETLIIENTLNTQGDAGWIVPIPASPEEIDVSTPGLLPTLSMTVGPEIRDRPGGSVISVEPIFMLLVLFWVLYVLGRPNRDRWGLVISYVVFIFTIGMLMAIALPTGGSRGSEARTGVTVETGGEFGSYEVVVLDADSPEALNAWLTGNGFSALPAEGEGIVKDYIDEDWKFLAARLRQTAEGAARPHPLKVSFKTSDPVYPMRLTALTGSDVYLELTTISENGLETPGLTTEFRQRFEDVEYSQSLPSAYPPGTPWFHNEETRTILMHPELAGLLWHECVISHMSGSLSPDEMREDFHLAADEFIPCRRVYYSQAGVKALAKSVAFVATIVGVPFVYMLFWPLIRLQAKGPLGYLKVVASTGLLVMLPALLVLAFWPRIDVVELGSRGWDNDIATHVRYLIQKGHEKDAARWNEGDYWRDILHESYKERITEEDSPGNYTFTDSDGELGIRVWMRGGSWQEYTLNPEDEYWVKRRR